MLNWSQIVPVLDAIIAWVIGSTGIMILVIHLFFIIEWLRGKIPFHRYKLFWWGSVNLIFQKRRGIDVYLIALYLYPLGILFLYFNDFVLSLISWRVVFGYVFLKTIIGHILGPERIRVFIEKLEQQDFEWINTNLKGTK